MRMNLKSEDKFDHHLAVTRLGRNVCFVDPGTTTTTTGNIPAYLESGVTNAATAAEAAANTGYTPYAGTRVAGFNQNQAATQSGIMGLQGPTQFAPAGAATANVMNNTWANPYIQQAFMNPYQQSVTDAATREAVRQSDIQGVTSDAQFAKAGAFGGSRQGIIDAERQRNLTRQIGDIQSQGLNQAYQQGAGQFNAQQGQRLQSAQQLAQLGVGEQQADLSRLGAQAGVGLQQQQLSQQAANMDWQEYQRLRDYKKDQLNWLMGIYRGAPYQPGQISQTYSAPPNTTAQLAGLGIAGLSTYNMYNQPAGG